MKRTGALLYPFLMQSNLSHIDRLGKSVGRFDYSRYKRSEAGFKTRLLQCHIIAGFSTSAQSSYCGPLSLTSLPWFAANQASVSFSCSVEDLLLPCFLATVQNGVLCTLAVHTSVPVRNLLYLCTLYSTLCSPILCTQLCSSLLPAGSVRVRLSARGRLHGHHWEIFS